jgi:xanthine dehydrogenase YagS FAD-binding subunit
MATVGGNLLQRTRCPYFRDTAFACNKREPGSGCSALRGYNRGHAVLGVSEHCIAVMPSDMCVALAALDAIVQTRGPAGERSILFNDFHRLPEDHPERETVLEPGELITAIDLPASAFGSNVRYVKVRDRASYSFALVSVGAMLNVDDGVVRDVRLALGGIATKPWRAYEAEQSLMGLPANEASYRLAAEIALRDAQPFQFNAFKIELTRRAIVRALGAIGANDDAR